MYLLIYCLSVNKVPSFPPFKKIQIQTLVDHFIPTWIEEFAGIVCTDSSPVSHATCKLLTWIMKTLF